MENQNSYRKMEEALDRAWYNASEGMFTQAKFELNTAKHCAFKAGVELPSERVNHIRAIAAESALETALREASEGDHILSKMSMKYGLELARDAQLQLNIKQFEQDMKAAYKAGTIKLFEEAGEFAMSGAAQLAQRSCERAKEFMQYTGGNIPEEIVREFMANAYRKGIENELKRAESGEAFLDDIKRALECARYVGIGEVARVSGRALKMAGKYVAQRLRIM